ncbi:hypothetical protein ACFL43_03510 [Thermodesulfobacteriota bacterium]
MRAYLSCDEVGSYLYVPYALGCTFRQEGYGRCAGECVGRARGALRLLQLYG